MKAGALYKIFLIAITIILTLTVMQPISTVHAASFTVDNNGDAGDANPSDGICATSTGKCTLRAAIDETSLLAGPNTINIPAMTILLNSELRVPDHIGDDSVIINGAGRDQTIIDGNNKDRVFYFEARSGNHAISNLTIRNGKNTKTDIAERNGGGIFNEANLILTNVNITNSKAFQGGGVYNQFAFTDQNGQNENVPTLTLNSVNLTNNTGTSTELGYGGGGLFNGSVLVGNNVNISNNTAGMQGGGYYNGSFKLASLTNFTIKNNISKFAAGIDNDGGDLTLVNGIIDGNVSNCCGPSGMSTGGAGIYNNYGFMHITNVTISNNSATSTGGYGGGIYNSQRMELTNVAIINNHAVVGAGIFNGNYGTGVTNQLTIINTTISSNIATSSATVDAEGGGIFNTYNGYLYIYSSTIAFNSAELVGGLSTRSVNTLVELKNTILANNTDMAPWNMPDCRGTIISLGYNIVRYPDGNPAIGMPCTFSSQPSDKLRVDPLLGPLQGTPAYHALLANSPAIDTGTIIDCPSTDIRGMTRPSGLSCDSGSYELQSQQFQYRIFLPLTKK